MIHLLLFVLTLTVNVPALPVSIDDDNTEAAIVARLFELKGGWSDQPDADPGLDITSLLMGGIAKQRSFPELMKAMESAITDEEIDIIVIDLSGGTRFSMPQVADMCTTLDRGRDSGKKIIAWMENGTTSLETIAASCDTILLTNTGGVDLGSPALMPIHFKNAMDLFGIEASVKKIAKLSP